MNRLILGTAQFGMDYGIANRGGKIQEDEALSILHAAADNGIRLLDTAYGYGDSEKVIGRMLSASGLPFEIISKLPDMGREDFTAAKRYFFESLSRLGQKKMHGYLVHRLDNIRNQREIWNSLKALKENGFVDKIGISIYSPEELKYILDEEMFPDIVQFPYNIFDQRFEPYLPVMHEHAIETHARSVFLQGAFFLKSEEVKGALYAAKMMLERLKEISLRSSISLQHLCLGFVMLNALVDKIVIGVDSKRQLEENVSTDIWLKQIERIYKELQSLQLHEDKVILPYNWA